jgi:hypothetical protein
MSALMSYDFKRPPHVDDMPPQEVKTLITDVLDRLHVRGAADLAGPIGKFIGRRLWTAQVRNGLLLNLLFRTYLTTGIGGDDYDVRSIPKETRMAMVDLAMFHVDEKSDEIQRWIKGRVRMPHRVILHLPVDDIRVLIVYFEIIRGEAFVDKTYMTDKSNYACSPKCERPCNVHREWPLWEFR